MAKQKSPVAQAFERIATATPRRRNAQDATRVYDITPLRKRIVVLERTVKAQAEAILKLQKNQAATDALLTSPV